ncbi:MAG TPA: ATP-binding protein [Candidatus Polarisedimenticolia bacterium]|nr:ATP-binding protein [Candidatus Polarisedimenticolia bacterium]
MRSRSLLGQLLRDQVLLALLSAVVLVLAGTGATAILLRKQQDDMLRSLGRSLCHTIAEENREESSKSPAEAAQEALGEVALSDLRIEVEDAVGKPVASSGSLDGWSRPARGALAQGKCTTRRSRGQGPLQGSRACFEQCKGDLRILVAASNIHGRSDIRLAVKVMSGTLLVLLGTAALAGRALIRRRLQPLQRLASAAARLGTIPGSTLGVGAEPSELARLESSIDHLLGQLQDALRREKRFTQEASHELRTSLTVLRARVEGLRARALDPDRLAVETGALIANLDALDRLVEALLLLARSEEDAELPRSTVNLCDLAREAAQARREADGGGSPALEVVAPDEILVAGSEELLGRALSNLVDNARKFGGAAARIRIHVAREDSRACVSVEDSGPGIPAESRPHVFERFFRDPSRRGSIQGTGLGLAVVRSIALRHHGGVSTGGSDALGGEAVRMWLPILGSEAHPQSLSPLERS